MGKWPCRSVPECLPWPVFSGMYAIYNQLHFQNVFIKNLVYRRNAWFPNKIAALVRWICFIRQSVEFKDFVNKCNWPNKLFKYIVRGGWYIENFHFLFFSGSWNMEKVQTMSEKTKKKKKKLKLIYGNPLYMGSEGFQILLQGLWKCKKKNKTKQKTIKNKIK